MTQPLVPLDKRLLEFAIAVGAATRTMPRDPAGRAIAAQLSRSGMAPAANYAEARDAVSGREYAFKLQLCLKELRETMVWIRVAKGNGFSNADYAALEQECHELTAILVRLQVAPRR